MTAALYGVTVFIAIACILLGLFLLKKFKNPRKVFKIFVLVVALFFFIRFMWDDNANRLISALSGNDQTPFLNFVSIILMWFTTPLIVMLCLYPFFKIRTIRNFIIFFGLPVAFLNIVFLWANAHALNGTLNWNAGQIIRGLIYAIECALLFAGCFVFAWRQGTLTTEEADEETFSSNSTEKWTGHLLPEGGLRYSFSMTVPQLKALLLLILPVLIVSMPVNLLQSFFGAGPRMAYDNLGFAHRTLIYFTFISMTAFYFVFRKQNIGTKRCALIFVSVVALINFLMWRHSFASFIDPMKLPLSLCTIAAVFIPLSLIHKLDKLFYFTLFIAVVGAFMAMLVPNTRNMTLFNPGTVSFWLNHMTVFMVPLLAVAFGVFPRPKWQQFTYSLAGFAVYFGFILVTNAWIANSNPTVDYFFLNSDFIVSRIGTWAENLRVSLVVNITIGDGTLTFYPVYQAIFFGVFTLACLFLWYIYEFGYKVADGLFKLHADIRKIRLDELALKTKDGRKKQKEKTREANQMLKLTNLNKSFGNAVVVKDVNLEVNPGEIFALLGPNGAGKSTILKNIVGIHPSTSGKVEVCGFDVEAQGIEAKMQIGFVPDQYALYERLTGREYINYIADLYEVNQADRNERIKNFLEIFEMKAVFDRQIRTYSYGMKQKIAIMAALIHNPKVWILDEPLTGLDPNSIWQVKEAMKQHAKEGNIVFFASHIIDVVERICDRIAIIKKGEIIENGIELKELNKKGIRLEDFYLNAIEGKSAEELSAKDKTKEKKKKK